MISTARKEELRSKYKNSVEMAVSSIRFTQKSVNNTFSNGAPIKWTIEMLRSKQIKPCEIPLIRVGFHNGYYKSIDNRRLYCYKTANITKIAVIMMESITEEFYCKDQSPNNGISVKIISGTKPASCHRNMVTAYNPVTGKTRLWTVGRIISQCKTMKSSKKNKKRMSGKNKSNDGPKKTKINIAETKAVRVSRKKKSDPNEVYFCTVCDIKMSFKDKSHHLNGNRHKLNLNADKPYFCTICDRKMSLRDKANHLNGKGHRINLKKQNEKNGDQAIKSTALKPKISANNNNNNNNNKIANIAKTKAIKASTKEKSDKNKTYFCTVCDTKMSFKDKSHHLNGRRHELNLKKHNEKIHGGPTKSASSKPTISVNNNNNDVKSSKQELNKNNTMPQKAKPKQTQYTEPKIAIDSTEFEFEVKMAAKTKEIKGLEIKLNDEKVKSKSLAMINKKLKNELLIQSDNNKGNDIMIDSMKKQMNYLRNRISEQEMELNQYKKDRESLDVLIDIGMNDIDAKIIGVYYYWFCCCCKKRRE